MDSWKKHVQHITFKIFLSASEHSLALLYPPLSGDDIWIKVLPQKRYTVHIDGCDIWNDLRPFLKYLVGPFSNKLRSKEAKRLKSGILENKKFS